MQKKLAKSDDIPFSIMRDISGSGIFVKHFGRGGTVAMKHFAHRDDYYIVVLLTGGTAAVEVDFHRLVLTQGDMLVVSPWQVHGKPVGETWCADGWLLGISPELLTDSEAMTLGQYSLSPHPLSTDTLTLNDLCKLCAMIERYGNNAGIVTSLTCAVKSIVLSAIGNADCVISPRYAAITLRLRRLIDGLLADEKSPAAYASMLNVSEVYLNEAVKAVSGLSAGAYIRHHVVVQARRQLAYSGMSAKEVAYSLGYDDYAYFSRLFKKNTGVTPAEYRKNLK